MSDPEQISGVFERIVWRSKDDAPGETPYIIGRIRVGKESVGVKGNSDPAEFLEGVTYTFQGTIEKNPKYGKTMKFASWRAEAPHSRRGLTLYLQRHCEGIGSRRASDLYDAFGNDAVAKLRQDPEEVHKALKGAVTLEVLRNNSRILQEQVKTETVKIELIDLLSGRGFGMPSINQCISQWGLNAAQVIRDNPFQLMMKSIKGAGFLRCDSMYLELGHDPAAITRQVFAIAYLLKEDTNGNTWLKWSDTLSKLNRMISSAEVNGKQALAEAIEMGLVAERKNEGETWVAEAKHAENERTVAIAVKKLLGQGSIDDPRHAQRSDSPRTAALERK